MTKLTFLVSESLIVLALTVIQSLAQSTYEPYAFTTLAGGGGYSHEDAGSVARFSQPFGVAVDSATNIYVADVFNHAIRKVTPDGAITTLAGLPGSFGSADGSGSEARFNTPNRVAIDSVGNVYVADTGNNTLRKVTPEGVVTTIAGRAGSAGSANGTNSTARFREPYGVAVDNAGNVYVADSANGTIRQARPSGTNWVVTTIAGQAGTGPGSADGTNSAARFNYPAALAVDSVGNVYVVDPDNHNVRRITPMGTNWVTTTLAGRAGSLGSADGTNNTARFNRPFGVAVDGADHVYVGEDGNSVIRQLTLIGTNWVVTTPASLAQLRGTLDGTNSAARFNAPNGLATDSAGNVYVADANNDLIRKMTPVGTNWVVTTLAGLGVNFGNTDGIGTAAGFAGPSGIAVDNSGNIYVTDQANDTVRRVTPEGVVTTLAGLAGHGANVNATNSDARFNYPAGVAVDGSGNLYVADTYNSGIRRIAMVGTNWVVTTAAGAVGSDDYAETLGSADGVGTAARFTVPRGVALDSAGNLYVADTINSTIRKVTPAGLVTTLAGQAGVQGGADGSGITARFNNPGGVTVDGATNVYVADTWNHTIRKMTPAKVVTTIAGKAGISGSGDGVGTAARFNYPSGVAVDSTGNIYVADTYNNTVRKLRPAGTNWVVTTLGGMAGYYGTADGAGSTARFSNPNGIAVDSDGNIYVADYYFNTIRKGYTAPVILNPGFNLGQFSFDLTGPTGRSVVVEASSDLVTWLSVWTNTFAGPLNFSEPRISSNRFYRTRVPQ